MHGTAVIIVDSSIILKWVCSEGERCLDRSDALLKDMTHGVCNAYAPMLSMYEVCKALLKGKHLPPKRAGRAMRFLHNAPINLIPESFETAMLTYRIAHAHNITYYDAAFLALAKTMGGTLVTDDVKHQANIPGVEVISLSAYPVAER